MVSLDCDPEHLRRPQRPVSASARDLPRSEMLQRTRQVRSLGDLFAPGVLQSDVQIARRPRPKVRQPLCTGRVTVPSGGTSSSIALECRCSHGISDLLVDHGQAVFGDVDGGPFLELLPVQWLAPWRIALIEQRRSTLVGHQATSTAGQNVATAPGSAARCWDRSAWRCCRRRVWSRWKPCVRRRPTKSSPACRLLLPP